MSKDKQPANEIYRALGYNDDLLPEPIDKRTWSALNYFTLWQGSVHNIPNYIAVGGFFLLGLSSTNIIFAITLSGLFIAAAMVLNGAPGTRYGIPGSMLLRASYGIKGAIFPGVLRGCIAAIMWFGLQNYAGSLALLIIIGKIWPAFLHIGEGSTFLGLTIPNLISFILFCAVNLWIGLAGGNALKRFTAILNPCIYIVFGGMAIWAVYNAGMANILNYMPANVSFDSSTSKLFLFLVAMNAVIAVWAAPMVNAADFTRTAKSFKSQAVGQTLGLGVAYFVFGIASVCILAGSSIIYQVDTWNVLDLIEKWDSAFLAIFASTVLLMTTVSTNATGNIIPAGYQLIALFPKLNYKQAVIIATIISILICPWKLMENQDSIFLFLGIIGGILGPVVGIMIAHYFLVMRQKIDLNDLYVKQGHYSYYPNGYNNKAFITTIVAAVVSLGGEFIPEMKPLSELSWFVAILIAFVMYTLLMKKEMQLIKSVESESEPN